MIQLFNKRSLFMKKLFVMCLMVASLVACDKDEQSPATDTVSADSVSDAVDVADDVSAVDASVDVTGVDSPDVSTSTDASVGG
jgi:hypothetical protein